MSRDATHLIKRTSQVVIGALYCLDILGRDYDTLDGTCIRDDVPVSDLAATHVDVLGTLRAGKKPRLILNCGYGRGFSVREVIAAIEDVFKSPIKVRDAPRRAGDPMRLVAESTDILRPPADGPATTTGHSSCAPRWSGRGDWGKDEGADNFRRRCTILRPPRTIYRRGVTRCQL